jgi:hypothetical protein
MRKRRWNLIAKRSALAGLIFITVALVLKILPDFSKTLPDLSQDKITCLQGYRPDMSPTEVSAFFDLPLVTFVTLPESIIDEPDVAPYVYYPIESPYCGLSIRYHSDLLDMPAIEMHVHRSSSSTITHDWLCFNYGLETKAEYQLQSVCSKTLNLRGEQLFISVSTIYEADETRKILEENDLITSQSG